MIDKPAAVGITPVSIDHAEYLGTTLTEIAFEKAGILKPGVPAIIGPQLGDAMKAIRARATTLGITPKVFDEDWLTAIKPKGANFTYTDWGSELELPVPSLVGEHQIINAGMAIALAHAQKAVSIPDAAIRAGLGWVRWPARLQEITGTRLNALLPEGSSLWLDGGHNPAAGHVVRDFLAAVDPVERSVTLILGMLSRKDAKGYLSPLSGIVNRVIAVPVECDQDAAEPAFLAGAATDVGINGVVAKDVASALQMVNDKAHPSRPPFVLIGGSLYLAGNVLREIGQWPG